MLNHATVNQEVERGLQDLAQADDRVDSEKSGGVLPAVDGGLKTVHGANSTVGPALELVLTPASSFPQHLHPLRDAAGQLSVGLGDVPVRPPRSLFALLRSHSAQLRHCETPGQEGQAFSP